MVFNPYINYRVYNLVYLPIKAPTHEQNNLQNTNITKGHIHALTNYGVTLVMISRIFF
jgi:hypothetical protein